MAGKVLKRSASGKHESINAERVKTARTRSRLKADPEGPAEGSKDHGPDLPHQNWQENDAAGSRDEKSEVTRRSTRSRPANENTHDEDTQIKAEPPAVPPVESFGASSKKRSGGGMSAFEMERVENIRRNQEMLRALGLGAMKTDIGLNATAQALQQARKRVAGSNRGLKPAKREPRAPTRRSARMEGKEAPFYNEEKLIMEVEAQSAREEEKRMDKGPLTLETLNRSEEGGADFLVLLKELLLERSNKASAQADRPTKSKPDMDYLESLSALTLAEEDILKLTPARISSMVVHPSERTLVVVAADVDGHLGVWQVEGDKEVFKFRPHISKVASMQYHPADPSKLISSSHDGTVRCLDLAKEAFDLLVATDDIFQDSGFTCASQVSHSPENLYLAGYEGSTGLLDLRSRKLSWVHGEAHAKKVNSIEAHPTREHVFISSSTDRVVTLWDDRKPKKEVWSIAHTNSINNASFSPTGAYLLITCQDHKLYLHADPVAAPFTAASPPDLSTAQYRIKHNNNTGRWLSKFWPTWDPKHPDAFVVGSLEQPRRIEVFSASSGFQIASVRSEWMNSVQSINQFHPSRNILVGANSSGRVHLFRGPGEERR